VTADDWTGISPLDGNIIATGGGPVGVLTYVGIGTTNLGIGNTVYHFTDFYDPKSIHKSQSELIGYYYPIDDPGCGTTITSSVQTLENEIITIRSGISTLLSPTNNARIFKVDSQTDVWWITKTQLTNSNSTSSINTLNSDLDNIL
jgi:hypothetical protein